jgi:hypothetical protein
MRDHQVQRYARHILVPDIGGLGQTALLVATARMELPESKPDSEPDAELIAATFLAAGGVGKLAIHNITDPQIEQLSNHGPDTTVIAEATTDGSEVILHPKPTWWPAAPGDALALAYWRGSIAATRWMATIANDTRG